MTILLYHGVAPQEERTDLPAQAGIYKYRKKFISPEIFEQQLEYLKKEYTILPLEEALQRLRSGNLPKNALSITFDDGYENNYLYAFPILKGLELPATFFVTTDFVFEKKPLWVDRLEYASGAGDAPAAVKQKRDGELRAKFKKFSANEREERLRYLESKTRSLENFAADRRVYAPLTTEQMSEMVEAGMQIGAHTKSHPILSYLSFDEARSENVSSKLMLEQHGFVISPVFAYPNGQLHDWSERDERIAQEAGFTAALTTIQGVNTRETPAYRIRRIAMDGTDAEIATVASVVSGMRLYLSRAKHFSFSKPI